MGILGKPCCLVFGTKDQNKEPSQPFRTLFIQECMKRGVLASSLVVGYPHSEQDIDRTNEAMHEAMVIYSEGLDEGVESTSWAAPRSPPSARQRGQEPARAPNRLAPGRFPGSAAARTRGGRPEVEPAHGGRAGAKRS